MLNEQTPRNRRRNDGDGDDRARSARRRIAEAAFELFVESGEDRSRQLECWRRAEESIVQRPDMTHR